MERRSLMTDIRRRQNFSSGDGLHGLTNDNAIHHDFVAGREICNGKLMLGLDIGFQNLSSTGGFDYFVPPEVGERDEHVVARIELKDAGSHRRTG